jgi:hypothetical protein
MVGWSLAYRLQSLEKSRKYVPSIDRLLQSIVSLGPHIGPEGIPTLSWRCYFYIITNPMYYLNCIPCDSDILESLANNTLLLLAAESYLLTGFFFYCRIKKKTIMMVLVWFMLFNATFNNISVISWLWSLWATALQLKGIHKQIIYFIFKPYLINLYYLFQRFEWKSSTKHKRRGVKNIKMFRSTVSKLT